MKYKLNKWYFYNNGKFNIFYFMLKYENEQYLYLRSVHFASFTYGKESIALFDAQHDEMEPFTDKRKIAQMEGRRLEDDSFGCVRDAIYFKRNIEYMCLMPLEYRKKLLQEIFQI